MAEAALLGSLMTASRERQRVAPASVQWKKYETPAFEVEKCGDGGMTPVSVVSYDDDDDGGAS